MVAKAGDKLPNATLYETDFDHTVELTEIFKGKKGVLIGLPGAFTPVCSSSHLPGFVEDFEKYKEAGAEVLVCTSTDNAYALSAWGEQHKVEGKVRMLADPDSVLAKALGVESRVPHLGSVSKRYSAVISDNVIKNFNLEDDLAGFGLVCSKSADTLKQLKQA